LIAEQGKVRTAVEKTAAKYAPLEEKVRAARAEVQPPPAGSPKPDPAKPAPPLSLDPERAKQLEALRKELAEMARQEQQNVQLGQQVAGDLKQTAEKAASLPLMPAELAEQLRALEQAFQQAAVQPLQELAGRMARGADPKQDVPDLRQMQQRAD